MTNTEKLTKMKEAIEKAKSLADQAEGAISQLKTSLKNEFGIDTVEEADKLLEELEQEKNVLIIQEQDLITELEQSYEWT